MARILDLIYDENPYVGFPVDEYPPDLQGWGSKDPVFEEIIQDIRPRIIIEVGSWKGASAIHMGAICRRHDVPTEIICVDTWLGSAELITTRAKPEWRTSLNYRYGYPQLFYTFIRNVIEHHLAEVITPFPASSDVAFYALKRLGIQGDLIYIDGGHEYDSVLRDLELYRQLLAPEGTLMGDDFKSPGVERAVNEFVAHHDLLLEDKGRKYLVRQKELSKKEAFFPPRDNHEFETDRLEVRDVTFDEIVERIRNRQTFSLSRWGDCEWHVVFGRTEGKNLDGHEYMPGLVRDLRAVLRGRPRYLLGLQPLARRVFEGEIERWLAAEHLTDLNWIESDVMHRASKRGKLGSLISAIRSAPKFVVLGPPHLADAHSILEFDEMIAVPPMNCYLEKDRLVDQATAVASSLPSGSVITFSATATANLLIDELFGRFGHEHFLIDVGSLWDPLAGVRSRKYMQQAEFEPIASNLSAGLN